ncbi:MAG: AraC family transcriptional regulator, partial [Treponema sp.]|nr:AraC family transcriptional regulator [Treponema sp.]
GGINSCFVLPEHGIFPNNGRAVLLFRQLLDISRNSPHSVMYMNYALGLLFMEISQLFYQENTKPPVTGKANAKMENIIEWIRINYQKKLSLPHIAKIFEYNPDYLSTAFRKYTGLPIMKYITLAKINEAKCLLLNTRKSVKEITFMLNFSEEKVFTKCFKNLEHVSPYKYRTAFSRAKLVKGHTKKR